MAKIISHRHREEVTEWERRFDRGDGGGYGFSCDKDGNPKDPSKAERIRECVLDPTLKDRGIVMWKRHVSHPTIIECNGCHKELHLWDSMTNECDCGRFYNGGGQELQHPRNWGEETGERFDDHGNYIGGGDE